MSNVKYPEITVNIVGVDGNAFNILGICTREMRKHHLPKSEIDSFFKEATGGSYDDLLCTVMKWFNVEYRHDGY